MAVFTFSLILVKGGSVLDLIAKDSGNFAQMVVFLTGTLDILQ